MVNVNLWGAILGCHMLVDWLKANPRGAHIVNVASIAAVASGPTMSAYNSTKAGVISLSETLFVELRSQGVGVTVVCPGFFPSQILASGRFCSEADRVSANAYMQQATVTADGVATAVMKAIKRKQLYVILPLRARVLWWIKRLMPRLLLRLIAGHYGKTVGERSQLLNPAGASTVNTKHAQLPATANSANSTAEGGNLC